MKQTFLFAIFAGAILIGTTSQSADGIQLMLAPRVTLPNLPIYEEDSVNFYGTNVALLQSDFLRSRAESQIQKKAPASLRVEAKRVPETSIISISVSGADESISKPFLSALVDQFLKFKSEQKQKHYHDVIAKIDIALQSAPPESVQQLKTYRQQIWVASVLDVMPVFEKID